MDAFLDSSREKLIDEIAQELECGLDCYYNFKTNELVAIPNMSCIADEDDFRETFKTDLEKVEKHRNDYIMIKVSESHEGFLIMEKFVEQLPDQNLKLELENILARKKPFQNFKNNIEHSYYRQNWFDFKRNELKKRVETVLYRGKSTHNN